MQYWLVKSDPDEYGWRNLEKDGATEWTGVRNFAARLHLNGMKEGDRVLYYHSGSDKAVMGIAAVAKAAYPDPTAADDKWVAVALKPVRPLPGRVSLAQIKAEKRLRDIGLVRIGRLSVMPLKKNEFDLIVKMGG